MINIKTNEDTKTTDVPTFDSSQSLLIRKKTYKTTASVNISKHRTLLAILYHTRKTTTTPTISSKLPNTHGTILFQKTFWSSLKNFRTFISSYLIFYSDYKCSSNYSIYHKYRRGSLYLYSSGNHTLHYSFKRYLWRLPSIS